MELNYESRIRRPQLEEKIMSARAAAEFIRDGMTLGMSGFTRGGSVKRVPLALAQRAEREDIKVTVITGASLGNNMDTVLAKSHVMSRRLPFQSDAALRYAINHNQLYYIDQNLADTAVLLRNGHMPPVDVAIIEAVAITEEGWIVPTTSIGNDEIFASQAGKIIIEVNLAQPVELEGIHDIYVPKYFPNAEPIMILKPDDRIGTTTIRIDPEKIVAIVITDEVDSPADVVRDPETALIGHQLMDYFTHEIRHGRLTNRLFPLQAGIGSVASGALSQFVDSPFHDLTMYSEVLQDGTFDLIDAGKMVFASGTSITVSPERNTQLLAEMGRYRDKIMLRPQEISNHQEVIRRLNLIAINTAMEADIYGNVNSTHVLGTNMMNGIGGSGDFTHNAHTAIFVTKSVIQGGKISRIVPMVPHVDHNEHDVDVLVTEHGWADLRGLAPRERAEAIINNCVGPEYKVLLREYLNEAKKRGGQTPHVIERALEWHQRLRETGSMLP